MHDFIRHIFYIFQQAIPPALIALAIGAVLLVLLNRKHRQEGTRFPKDKLLLSCCCCATWADWSPSRL